MTSRAVDHHLENIIGHRVLIELLLGNKILLKNHLGDRVLLDGDLFQMGSTVSGGDQPENLLGDRVLLQNNLCVGDLLQSNSLVVGTCLRTCQVAKLGNKTPSWFRR